MDGTLKRELEDKTNELEPTINKKLQLETDSGNLDLELNKNGISEFIGKHEGFFGIIKQRWEDFLVNEIDLNGKVVYLTNTDLPPTAEEMENNKSTTKSTPPSSSTASLAPEIIEQIESFLQADEQCLRLPASEDKEERKNFHDYIKEHYVNLDGSTTGSSGSREYVLMKSKGQRTTVQNSRNRPGGQIFQKLYCTFVLYKEGKDTMSVVNLLSRMLHLNSNAITFAGNKDRRAITVQRCSLRGINPQRLSSLNATLRGIKLGNFEYQSEPIHLGDLIGNRFTLVIRDVVGCDEMIDKSMKEFQSIGFINYYGDQRFGTSRISTSDVGVALLKRDWTEAIKLILTPTEQDLPAIRQFKEKYVDAEVVSSTDDLSGMPISIEKTLLYGIQKHGGRNLSALLCIQRQTLQLYVHSVQSLVWNRVVSRRIKSHGLQVFAGDLIYQNDSSTDVVHLAEEAVEHTSIYDVLVPLPGRDIVYPTCHQMEQIFKEELETIGLQLESLTSKQKEFHLCGAYRQMVALPKDLTYAMRKYDDPNEPLVSSGVDLTVLPEKNSEGSKKAVVVGFNLPKSAYATVAMRELMKTVQFCK